jgi:hypothetical protein
VPDHCSRFDCASQKYRVQSAVKVRYISARSISIKKHKYTRINKHYKIEDTTQDVQHLFNYLKKYEILSL